MAYNPLDWYWQKKDGTLFSSKRQIEVQGSDKEYKAWLANGDVPTRYPLDDAGQESEAEMAAVLEPFGISVLLTDYVAAKRYAVETGGYTYDGHLISTDRDSQSKIGNVALAANIVGSAFSTDFKCADGSFFALDQAGAIAMATAVMNFVSGCFTTEADIHQKIADGDIKTRSDVDSVTWPASSS